MLIALRALWEALTDVLVPWDQKRGSILKTQITSSHLRATLTSVVAD